jgi:hypothetical protein
VVQDYGAVEDEDIDMMDSEYKYEAPDHVDQIYPARCDRDTGEDEDRNENARGRSAGNDGGDITSDIGGFPWLCKARRSSAMGIIQGQVFRFSELTP